MDSRGNSKGLRYKDVAPSEVGSLDAIVAMRHEETLSNSGTATYIYIKYVKEILLTSKVGCNPLAGLIYARVGFIRGTS